MTTVDDLLARSAAGERLKFVFFWSHEPKRHGSVDASCFSQWYASPFDLEGVRFPTAEHAFMAEKAKLFKDNEAYERIVAADSPGAAKAFGREVFPFDQAVWDRERLSIARRVNRAKFESDDSLREFLIGTNTRVIVEASPVDKIWGVGLEATDETIEDPSCWLGLNLLGFTLMDVRDDLRA